MTGRNVRVRFYDGRSNVPQDARLALADDVLYIVREDGKSFAYPVRQAVYMPSVGSVPAAVEFPDDARAEFSDGVPEWLALERKKLFAWVSVLENNSKAVCAALVLLAFTVFAAFRWGIPAAAYHAAHSLPENTLQHIGAQAENVLESMTADSKISQVRQNEIRALYSRLKTERPAKLRFRAGGQIGTNAFAVPNNTIVLTDELIETAANDEEILAVLAHEQGHLHHRHSLQQVLRGLGVSVFQLALTGDAGDLFGNLPLMLAAAQYSQSFESEADLYAVNELKRLGVAPQRLADFLKRIARDDEGAYAAWLGTHPETAERVKQIEAR